MQTEQNKTFQTVQYNDPYCTDCSKRQAWIEFMLVDEHNAPVAGISYSLMIYGGETRQGRSGKDGLIRVENLPLTSVILKTDAQELADEMELRPLREGRGPEHSEAKALAAQNDHSYRYVVIGELCDRAPVIQKWNYAAFGLPRYHFKSETDFPGIRFSGKDFNRRHMIEICPFRAWSLILNHTRTYDLVNAYNLALMALLSYCNETMQDPDSEKTNMRPVLDEKNTVSSFFYNACFDLSAPPSFEDGARFYAVATDVPFRERYRPAIFLDSSQAGDTATLEHKRRMFFVENNTHIIVSWRGTDGKRDLMTDVSYKPVPYSRVEKAKAHYGFLDAYECMGRYFSKQLDTIPDAARNKQLFLCGHSLGGTGALLHAADLKDRNPLVYTYGMPRVFTRTAVHAFRDLPHFRHVNDADAVTSVPSDTNMDSWLFEAWGWFGIALGTAWTIASAPTLPVQKALPDFGEVYWHHGQPVAFFEARQIGEDRAHPAGKGNSTVKARWRFDSGFKFYLVPGIREDLSDTLKEQQEYLISSADKNVLGETFPQYTNPALDTVGMSFAAHSMSDQYMRIISNQMIRQINEKNTPEQNRKRTDFISRIDRADAYPPNVARNNTFLHMESVLGELFRYQHSNNSSKTALIWFEENTREFI